MTRDSRGHCPPLGLLLLVLLSSVIHAKDLIINRLQLDGDKLNISCGTGGSISPNDSTDRYELTLADNYYESEKKPTDVVQVFEIDPNLIGEEPKFTLQLKTGDDVKAAASVEFLMKDLSATKAWWVGAKALGETGNILRLSGNENHVKICPDGVDGKDCLNFGPNDKYQMSSRLSGPTAFTCLFEVSDPDIPFCVGEINIQTSEEIEYEGEIRLTYQEDQTAPRSGTLSVEESSLGKQRDLLYFVDSQFYFCLASNQCLMEGFPSKANQYDVFFVECDENDEVTGSSLVTNFNDYTLNGTVIASGFLEMHWWGKEFPHYRATLTDPKGNRITSSLSPFTSADVICEEDFECFAYFFDSTESAYRVMVQPINQFNYLVYTNTILSSKQSFTGPRREKSDLEITEVYLDWSKDGSKASATVCFNKAAGKALNNFEMVMVNQKGNWIRSRSAIQKTVKEACFSGVTLVRHKFIIVGKVAVIILERGADGRSVIDSVRTEAVLEEALGLTINKIEIVDYDQNKYTLQYGGISNAISGDVTIVRTDEDPNDERSFELKSTSNFWADFVVNTEVKEWIEHKNKLKWILRLQTEDGTVLFGMEEFSFPELQFPSCGPAHTVGNEQLLRMECVETTSEEYVVSLAEPNITILNSTGVAGITYHLLNESAGARVHVQICRHPMDNTDIYICMRRIEVANGTASAGSVTAITLEYNSQVDLEIVPNDNIEVDGIVYYYGTEPTNLKHCPENNTCDMKEYGGGEDVEVVVVYKDVSSVAGSQQYTVYDLELSGKALTDTIFEITIKKMEGRDVYQVVIEQNVPSEENNEDQLTTKVMCEDVGPTCYAYFFSLASGDYKATVAPYTNQGDIPDPMNQVVVDSLSNKDLESVTHLDITQITRVENNETWFGANVAVATSQNVTEITNVIMILAKADGTEEYVATATDIGEGTITTEQVFRFDINPADSIFRDGTRVVLLVKGDDEKLLAEAEAIVEFQIMEPALTWVGGEDLAPLRVATDLKLEINGTECDSRTCYLLDFENAGPPELCVTLNNTAPSGNPVRQCDLTQIIGNTGVMTDEEIQLNYNEEQQNIITVSSSSSPRGLEVVLYDKNEKGNVPKTFSCDAETCSSNVTDEVAALGTHFNVLVVGLDMETVTNATMVPFEDFQVRVQRFSDDGDIEVRWRTSEHKVFNVHLNNSVSDGFSATNVDCGILHLRKCKAYFTKLNAGDPYKVLIEEGRKLVSATVPTNKDDSVDLSIKKFSVTSDEMQLTVLPSSPISDISFVEYVVIQSPSSGEAEQNITFISSIHEIPDEMPISFKDVEMPVPGNPVTVLVVVHGGNGVDSVVLAAGKAMLIFEDISPSSLTWVGGTTKSSLRVKTDLQLEISGEDRICNASTCYFFDFEIPTTPLELCVSLENAAPPVDSVKQCDMTHEIITTDEMTVNNIKLNYGEDSEHLMSVSADSPLLEVVLYDNKDSEDSPTFSCDVSPCQSDDISSLISEKGAKFNVLVVGLTDPNSVTNSTLLQFEDFQTRVQRFSDGDIEVRWRASSKRSFIVNLDNPVDGGFTTTTVDCGGEVEEKNRGCKAYFTKLNAAVNYTVEIAEDIKVVSATVPKTPEEFTLLTITHFLKSTSGMHLKFGADNNVSHISYVEYVVIDPPLNSDANQTIKFNLNTDDITTGENEIIFDDVEVPAAGNQVSVLLIAHGADGVDSAALAAGKAVLTFEEIAPSLTWVGGDNTPPLRVKTDLQLEISGEDRICEASTCYFLDFEIPTTPLELCVSLENAAAPGDSVKQCDMTHEIHNTGGISDAKMELNYNEEKHHIMTVSSASKNLEVVLYDDGDTGKVKKTFSCDGETCSSDVTDKMGDLLTEFKVLVVWLDNMQSVKNAVVEPFEDLKIRVQRFSAAGDIEARWRSTKELDFDVNLNGPVDGGFIVKVKCGSFQIKNCRAYFSDADETYKVQIERSNKIVSASVPANIGNFIPLNITQLSNATQMELTLSTPERITDIGFVEYVLFEPVSEKGQTIKFVEFTANIDAGEVTFNFSDVGMPESGKNFSVMIVMHSEYGVEEDALAAGIATLIFEDLSPTMTWVGGENTAPLRVATDLKLEINGTECDSRTCYLLDFENAGPPELCVTLENTASSGNPVRQCDLTQIIGNTGDMTDEKIQLNYNETAQYTMSVSSASNTGGLEVVLYDKNSDSSVHETFLCNEATCSSDVTDELVVLDVEFDVLVVGLGDAGDVVNSVVVPFEDFQVRVQRFSDAGDIEMRWKSTKKQNFQIMLTSAEGDDDTTMQVQCGGDEDFKCKAYFIRPLVYDLYTVEIEDNNKVLSASVPTDPGNYTLLSISRISQVSSSETQVTFSSETEVGSVTNVEFVLINNVNNQEIGFAESSTINEGVTSISFDVILQAGEMTVLVIAHGDGSPNSDALAAGKAVLELKEINPSLTWVGGTNTPPLRVDTDLRLEINGEDRVCEATTCYFLDSEMPTTPFELCVSLNDTLFGTPVKQCDSTQDVDNANELTVDEVQLNYGEDSKRIMSVSADSPLLEVVLYDDTDSEDSPTFSCDVSPCQSDDISSLISEKGAKFNVLVVGLTDPNSVTNSTLLQFEDFQTRVQRFSNDVIEVRWRASTELPFTVNLDNIGDGDQITTAVDCGGEDDEANRGCKAYFTGLDEAKDYMVEIAEEIKVVSAAVPKTPDDGILSLDIQCITKISPTPLNVRLAISSDANITGIEYVEFVEVGPASSQSITFTVTNDNIEEGVNTLTFTDVGSLTTGEAVSVLVVAHGIDGVDSDALAFGHERVIFEDMRLPKVTKVGSDGNVSLRVETDSLDITVNGEDCPSSSTCYILEPEVIAESPNVCRDMGEVDQCDVTGSYMVTYALDPIIDLLFVEGGEPEELKVTSNFNGSSVAMDVVVYDETGILDGDKVFQCVIEDNACKLQWTPTSKTAKLLLMAVDDAPDKPNVVESNTIEFEDYQTRVEQLTKDAIEVKWNGLKEMKYEIRIFPNPEGGFNKTSVHCGGAIGCSAFFIQLKTGETYVASVNGENDITRIVSARVLMEDISTRKHISKLKLSTAADDSLQLVVCLDHESLEKGTDQEKPRYDLAVLDAFGRQVHMTSDLASSSSKSDVEADLCLGPIVLDPQFCTTEEVRVIVSRSEGGGKSAADVAVLLLDPRTSVTVTQIGPQTLRADWKKRNSGARFEVQGESAWEPLTCEAGAEDGECVRYLHQKSNPSVTLREVGLDLIQEVEVGLTQLRTPIISVKDADLTPDGRLRVCFLPVANETHYVLSLEGDGVRPQEPSRVPSQEQGDLVCILTLEKVDGKGFASLRAFILALDASGRPVSSGTAVVKHLFLSPTRRVTAVLSGGDLLVSWSLLDHQETVNNYKVTLQETCEGSINDPVTEHSTKSSHIFKDVDVGRYSVCVVAYEKEGDSFFWSDEVCSAIVSVSNNKVDIPEVSDTSPKSIGLDKILVTWQKPKGDDDITAYVLTWTEDKMSSSASSPAKSRSRHPMPIVHQSLRSGNQKLEFLIVPADSTSAEIQGLEARKSYEVCVSAVREDVMGNRKCRLLDLGKYMALEAPSSLTIENSLLKWQEVPHASGYLVDWRPLQGEVLAGGHEEVTASSWATLKLHPGWWLVSVRATTDESASDAKTARYLINGIDIISVSQSRNERLLLRWWEEPAPPCARTRCTYRITVSPRKEPYLHSCSGLEGHCEMVVDVEKNSWVKVEVERQGVRASIKQKVYDFPEVLDINYQITSGGTRLAVSWAKMEEAKMYNVTLYTDETHSSIKFSGLISREWFIFNGTDLNGNIFVIQPCVDGLHCGDEQKTTLMMTSDPPASNSLFIAATAMAGIMLIAMVALSVAVVMIKRAKRKETEEKRRLEEAITTPRIGNGRGASGQVNTIPLSALNLQQDQ